MQKFVLMVMALLNVESAPAILSVTASSVNVKLIVLTAKSLSRLVLREFLVSPTFKVIIKQRI